MNDPQQLDAIDQELARLGTATEPLRARPGFRDRVMAAAIAVPSWQVELLRSARGLVPVAALAAVMAVAWALVSESSTDAVIAVSEDTSVLEW